MMFRHPRPLCQALMFGLCLNCMASTGAQPVTLTLDQAQTVGIDGRDWDKTFPGALTVDAVHRVVLMRFPDAAEQIKAKLDTGLAIEKAEVVLDYDGYEIAPQGYTVRTGLGEKKWKENPPQWHIVAWALRRPWVAEKEQGPTFNAFINGAGYWAKYGAGDTDKDRFTTRFGPSEVSQANPEGCIDVTALFIDPEFGVDAGRRLRLIEENGLLLKKWETYDVRYRDAWDAYEWAVPTGGHGLKFKNLRLVVTFKAGKSPPVPLPPPTDVVALAGRLKADGSGGKPTAVMPSPERFKELAQRVALQKPVGMSNWQFQRVIELYKIGGDSVTAWAKAVEAGDRQQYERLIRDILATPPRYWKGWGIQDDLLVWYLYRDLLPAYVQDHIKAYWEAWLMPDIPTKELFHPQSQEAADYWQKSKDWRGRTSFFRDGYTYTTSTQNFNHTAAMGALLGGSIIGSEYAMADGRHGLENFPMRLWAMQDGTTQEMLDHYYFSITLSVQKIFADFGPTALDRLMGRIILDRSMELLATAYHPNLRRCINASGRARLPGVLVEQDGIYGALHTLSRQGTLNYLDQPKDAKAHGMPIWGYDFPPGRVAIQSLPQKWAPDWVTNVIDNKPVPFVETATETTRGKFNPPLWRRVYLGRHYGLASQDIKGGTVDVMAQWNSKAEPATTMEDLGTLTLRYAINEPDMATTHGGTMPYAGGIVTYQHKNRAIVCTKPRTEKDRIIALAGKDGLKSLATVIALWNFRPEPGWEIYVDGQRITQFPARLKAGQVITVKDGVSYVGIIPLPATDLGRTDKVVIGFGGGGKSEPNGAVIKPALTITSYNFQKEAPVAFDKNGTASVPYDWPTINTATYGGFIIELGDVAEYGNFAAFSKRMQSNTLTTRWEPEKKLLHVAYRSGQDVLEMGFATDYAQSEVHFAVMPGQHTKAIPYRKINGAWPYLPPGIERDTTLAQQGTTGRLEKNGAVLTTDKGRKAYLQTEPSSGVYTGYNPLPDPTDWSLSVPTLNSPPLAGGARRGGAAASEPRVTIKADGKVSLLRVAVQPTANRLWLDYAAKANQNGPEMATHLLVSGFAQPPLIERNGQPLAGPFKTVQVEGQTAYVIPLTAR
ncbi:MAG: hypothetical protein M3347_11270 [Armatimonadota bacterium]|nr:hypothetical protein [Armatimonadota bacterium]